MSYKLVSGVLGWVVDDPVGGLKLPENVVIVRTAYYPTTQDVCAHVQLPGGRTLSNWSTSQRQGLVELILPAVADLTGINWGVGIDSERVFLHAPSGGRPPSPDDVGLFHEVVIAALRSHFASNPATIDEQPSIIGLTGNTMLVVYRAEWQVVGAQVHLCIELSRDLTPWADVHDTCELLKSSLAGVSPYIKYVDTSEVDGVRLVRVVPVANRLDSAKEATGAILGWLMPALNQVMLPHRIPGRTFTFIDVTPTTSKEDSA